MNLLGILVVSSLVGASIPALLIARNLMVYRRTARTPLDTARGGRPCVSVLIPARDEAGSIGECLDSVCATVGADIEVLVLDDGSTDGTAGIVRRHAESDRRIALVSAPVLPPGWCGKQHACATLAELARHDLLLFIDADVRLEPDAVTRMAAAQDRVAADLLSGFPRQVTVGLVERLLIPLIHFVLLGFLPMDGMRRSLLPAFGAGCGQLMLARRGAYRAVGGHGAIRSSLHDGLKLPRAFRQAGFRSDLVDATDLARCRMYRSARATWDGLGKNATEGLAAPGTIGPMSVWLLFACVMPPIWLIASLAASAEPWIVVAAATATALGPASRALLAMRFEQSWLSVLLHPVGVALLLGVQWQAAIARARGGSADWKGRHYARAFSDAE